MKFRSLLAISALLLPFSTFAQLSVYNIGADANALVGELVGTGVTYLNPTFTGTTAYYNGSTNANKGLFNGGSTVVGINSGIILSTGNVMEAPLANNNQAELGWYDNGRAGDATLNTVIGGTTYNSIGLEFDFIPESNNISFRYVFASEEYNDFVNTGYNDVFGFFVTGGPEAYSSRNIAIVPGTASTPVAIDNINNGAAAQPGVGTGPCENCAYYVDNCNASRNIRFDGLTTPLTASLTVTPCATYHMKIVIGDVGDPYFDSGVFLEANSFTSPSINNIQIAYSNPAAGSNANAVEGCSNATITLGLSGVTPFSRNVPFTMGGAALLNVDFYTIPDITGTYGNPYPGMYYVTIPAGSSSTTLQVVPLSDINLEGTEDVSFTVQTNLCGAPQYSSGAINILDNSTTFSGTIAPSATDICLGSSATLTFNPVGGQPPFTYTWNPTGYTTSSINVNPPSSTTYYVTVTDACSYVAYDEETVNVFNVPTVVPFPTAETICSGDLTNINLSSGVPNTSFTWVTSVSGSISGQADGAGTQIAQNLVNTGGAAGTVTYTVTPSANGCTGATYDVIVTVNPRPVVDNVTITDVVSCLSPDGTITLTASGGTPPLNYSLDGGSAQATGNFTNVNSGIHAVVVTDANSCSVTESGINIGSTSGTTIDNVATVNNDCFGDANGSITITATGATQYSIDNGVTFVGTNSFSGLTEGTYNVVIQDAGQCQDAEVVQITAPDSIEITATITDESCGVPGAVDALVTGGTGPYSYSWNTGGVTDTLMNILHGDYILTVTDANSCTNVDTFTVAFAGGTGLASVTALTDVQCNGGSDGSVTVQMSNGTAPYTYTWAHTVVNSPTVTGLVTGTYYVTISDTYGCTAELSATIDQPAVLNAIFNTLDISCHGNNDGMLVAAVNGGTPGYTVQWSNSVTGMTNNGLAAGTYTATVTDGHSCTAVSGNLLVSEPDTLVAIASGINPTCSGASDGGVSVTVTGGVLPYTYAWTGGHTTASVGSLSSGNYAITITDDHNCIALDAVQILSPPVIDLDDSVYIDANHSGQIDLTITGGALPYTYLWNTGAVTQDIGNLAGGEYFVTITDANMCLLVDSFEVELPLIIPTAITPNGDGWNDDFEISNIEAYNTIELEIFNRWGGLLFTFTGTGMEYKDRANRWDGTIDGKELPMGSYLYIIKLGDDEPVTGVVSIIR